ncbi:hypothetical protein RJT34_11455 [Clitoria ternatea]|uniref:Uncharacterized protein n=1 Tax=Clitoria ternatea TaxID=43366 RepID=A0AAN9JMJ8_CLITE
MSCQAEFDNRAEKVSNREEGEVSEPTNLTEKTPEGSSSKMELGGDKPILSSNGKNTAQDGGGSATESRKSLNNSLTSSVHVPSDSLSCPFPKNNEPKLKPPTATPQTEIPQFSDPPFHLALPKTNPHLLSHNLTVQDPTWSSSSRRADPRQIISDELRCVPCVSLCFPVAWNHVVPAGFCISVIFCLACLLCTPWPSLGPYY